MGQPIKVKKAGIESRRRSQQSGLRRRKFLPRLCSAFSGSLKYVSPDRRILARKTGRVLHRGSINPVFRVRGINPARDPRGCSPPLETPFTKESINKQLRGDRGTRPGERGHRNATGRFRPRRLGFSPSERTGWRPPRHRPIDRARKGLALGRFTPGSPLLVNSLVTVPASRGGVYMKSIRLPVPVVAKACPESCRRVQALRTVQSSMINHSRVNRLSH